MLKHIKAMTEEATIEQDITPNALVQSPRRWMPNPEILVVRPRPKFNITFLSFISETVAKSYYVLDIRAAS